MTDPGKRRHRVTIQALRPLAGTGADREESWVDVKPVWASIQGINGREFQWAREMFATSTHALNIRYTDGVSVKDRITFKGRIFNIIHIDNKEERNIELNLICVEEVK